MSAEVEGAHRLAAGHPGAGGVWGALGQRLDESVKMLLRVTPGVKIIQSFPVTVHGRKLGGCISIPRGTR